MLGSFPTLGIFNQGCLSSKGNAYSTNTFRRGANSMTTLITAISSDGKKHRCTASCHNAIKSTCHCACGGRFHSSAHRAGGVNQAVEDFWDEALKNIDAQGLKIIKAEAKVELPL
jgi:hypothetical protein